MLKQTASLQSRETVNVDCVQQVTSFRRTKSAIVPTASPRQQLCTATSTRSFYGRSSHILPNRRSFTGEPSGAKQLCVDFETCVFYWLLVALAGDAFT